MANVQVDGVPSQWEDSFPMAKALARSAPIAGIAIILLALSANSVLAWGDTAHRIICEIAFKELDSQARAEVKRLIRLDPVFFTFSGSCIWPDHPRKRSREHFVNLPRSASQIEDDPCPLADKCVVTAIESDLQVIANAGDSDSSKLDALKFLGHWVGDVHQPLHVSFKDDRGGNRIKEARPCKRNLHAVWDGCIIETKLGTDIRSIATELRGAVTPADRTQWNSTGPKTWANESFKITTSATVGYCIKKDDTCWYAADNRELDGNEQRRVVVVDDAYMERQLPTIKERLTQAGVRLGHLLNHAVGGSTNGHLMPTFSITNLVARIRETGAIGFFTKLALKNQIDDLLSEFREFHEGVSNTELAVLKDQFNLLLMKVITLLQDDDPKLFQDIVSAREFLWINLADIERFERL